MGADPAAPLRMERTELECGLSLVRQEAPAGAATFAATFFAPAGWAFDTPASGGRAVLVSELLTCGGGRWNRADLARLLDRFGATLSSHCHPESTEVTLWGPEAHLGTLLPLLADAVLRPRFEPAEIERLRRQLRERQMRERSQPDRTAEKELFGRIFPKGHPYRETGLGTPASLARLGRSELERFYLDRFQDRGSGLAISCREGTGAVARRLSGLFGAAERPGAPDPPRLPAPSRAAAGPHRLAVPGGSQMEIRIGGASLPRSDPEYPAAFLANEILGGRSL
ncbi:MAG: M16 family metallopeptidase, partial [Thermoplasmata archaeon]